METSLPISVREVYLETPRLVLREHTVADTDAVFAYASDPEVLRYRQSTPATREQVAESLTHIADHQRQMPQRVRYELAIVTRSDNRLIGWLPILLSDMSDRCDAKIGWTLNRSAWGQGYATEVARTGVGFAIETLRLHRLWAQCQRENTASAHVMDKIGMRFEGEARQERFTKGRWVDHRYYAILEDEWWAQQRTFLPSSPNTSPSGG